MPRSSDKLMFCTSWFCFLEKTDVLRQLDVCQESCIKMCVSVTQRNYTLFCSLYSITWNLAQVSEQD